VRRKNCAICRGEANREAWEDRADTEAGTAGKADAEAWADEAGTTTRSMEFFLALISPSFLQNMRKGKKMVPMPKKGKKWKGNTNRTAHKIEGE
jgi:hypothetical protein